MEPVERVRAALSLGVTDRPPVAWWGHTYREEWSPRELADVTIARRHTYGWDFVKLQPRACCFAEAFGSEYRPSDDPREGPILVRPAIADPKDWRRLGAVDASAPALRDQVEALRLVVEGVGPAVPVIQTLFSPLTVAGYLVGEDRAKAVAALRRDGDVVGAALERIADALAGFATASLEAGAAGIFFAISGYASADVMPVSTYTERALPHDRRVLEAVAGRSWFDVLHLCGPRVPLELAAAFDVHAVSWAVHDAGNPSLVEGRARTGRAVMGGLDHRGTVVKGSPGEVAAEARAAAEASDGAGVIVAPGCSVPVGAPERNLRAITGAT